MENSVKITIPFSFKGREHAPSSIINLDLFVQGDQTIDNAFYIVASENKIDNYSYEYEVLESSKTFFSDPTGIAVDFISDGNFDLDGFKAKIHEDEAFQTLQTIAADMLNIEDLNNNKEIKKALFAAYQAGKDASHL